MDIISQATAILRKPIGWIRLDLGFDIDKWIVETNRIKQHLVNHRDCDGDGHDGWRSCCLHGLGIDITGTNDNVLPNEYHWTSIADECPTITAFWKSFPTERFARLRFMELAAGGVIAPHCDAPNGVKNTEFDMMDHMIPINVAITHPDNCYMDLESYGRVPWKAGNAFVVNITDTHTVVNNSNTPRMHMIAHCVVGNRKKEFAELIVRSYNKNNELN
jgi:hypothetical protein